MAKAQVFELRGSEQILFERKAIIVREGALAVRQAYLTITTERIILELQSRFGMMFGLIGVLLAKAFAGEPLIIEKSQVASAQRVKFGLNDQGIVLNLHGGDSRTLLVKPHFVAIADAMQKFGVSVQSLAA